MKDFKLKECPCCGGEAEFAQTNFTQMKGDVLIYCTNCDLRTNIFEESLDYCAKEEAAKVWNKRYTEINRNNSGGITLDEIGHKMKKIAQEFSVRNITGEKKLRCPICGEEGLHILTLSYLPNKARAEIHCDICGTDIDIPDTSKCVGVMSELIFNEK